MSLSNTQIAKENKALLKSLGIKVRGLYGYNKLYNTTPYTFGYKDSSMWYCSINEADKTIQINTTYFNYPKEVVRYNKMQTKKHCKFNHDLVWGAYEGSMDKLRNEIKLSIHDKINLNAFGCLNKGKC